MKKHILFIILSVLIGQIQAQITISGTIYDANSKESLPAVQVFIPSLQKGCVSDSSGHYVLNQLPKGIFNIQFLYVGYHTHIESVNVDGSDIKKDIYLSESFIESQEVVVSAGGFSSQHENAIKVESIKASRLAEQGGLSLMENLTSLPGISMISKGKGMVTPVIRGLSTTNIVLLNNGVRMENFQFSENHPYMISEGGIDKIEVIKGPASLLYGSDAIGGIINLIHEKPAPIGHITGDFNLSYFNNTKGYQGNLGIKGTHKNLFWGIRANNKNHSDYRQGGGAYVPNSRFNEQSAHLFAGFNKHYGSFKLYYDYDQKKLGLSIPPSVNEVVAGENKNNIWYQDLNNHMLISKNKLFLGQWQLEGNFSYQNNHRLLKTQPENKYFIATDMLLQTLTYDLKAHWSKNKSQKLIFGYHGMNQNNLNGFAPEHVLPNYHLVDNSLFALFQQSFGEKLHTQMGLRYDHRWISVPQQYKTIETIDPTLMDAFEKTYQNMSGSVGFTYDIMDYLLARLNFSSAYRTPNIAELSEDGMHGNRYELGNKDLNPQRNYELDLSLHFHVEKFKLDVATFYNNINNYIFLTPTEDTTAAGSPIFQYVQNNSHLSGLEAGLEYQVISWLKLRTTYAHVIGIQENENYLPFIPQDKLQFSLKVEKKKLAFFKHFYFGAHTNFVAQQNKPSAFETLTDSYFLLDFSMGSKIHIMKQDVSWSIIVNNALDTQYIDHLSTLKPMGYNNIGRNISLSLKIPFEI